MGTVTEALSYDGPAASTVEVRVTPIRDSMEGSTVDEAGLPHGELRMFQDYDHPRVT